MNILLCGADGFIGRALETALTRAGHGVRRAVRVPVRPNDMAVDYRRDLDSADWHACVAGCDAVINAVGILTERETGDFERIHHRVPAALFAACAGAGVERVVQISALGAARADTPYLASKAAADRALLAACPRGTVLRPGLVFGEDGASSRLFLSLASLPLCGLPGGGSQPLRPIHIDDLCELVCALLASPEPPREIDAVGGAELTFAQLLATYRAAMGFAPARTFGIPYGAMRVAAALAGRVPGSLLTPDTWQMLERGNSAPVAQTSRLLGRLPRPPQAFVSRARGELLRERLLARWRQLAMRVSLGVLWIGSGALSLAQPQVGLELLGPFGLAGAGAWAVLVAAALLDIALGLATLLRPSRRLWLAQIGLICVYSGLIAWQLPGFLLHPFAPVLKNLPIVAMLAMLWAEEART